MLTRVACLGAEILKDYGFETRAYVNHQKSRIDFLLSFKDKKMYPEKSIVVNDYLFHKHVLSCIDDQKYDFFNYTKPDLIVIDSYSELTDQLFVHKKSKKVFLANYTDMLHDDNFKSNYHCMGLINLEDLFKLYRDFFDNIALKYQGVPVVFIHFSTALDDRLKFKERDEKIRSIINELKNRYDFLYAIELENKLVLKSDNINDPQKDFPYHYSSKTYEEFQYKFKEILNKLNFNVK
ncbi:MAG: hypothetical protein K2Q03_10000 [Sphingobacteriaceae bacterium]|nr:hypothetical protein [Sphingobacteriaceae bacterium]